MRLSLVVALYFESIISVLVLLQLLLARCRVLIKLDAAKTAVMLEALRMVTIDSNSAYALFDGNKERVNIDAIIPPDFTPLPTVAL